MSSPRTVAFHTLGCKLNFSETSTLARSLEDAGYAKVRQEERPDVFVLNTCSVTENADKECRRHVRRFQAINPEAFIAVVGCYAQLKPEEIAAIPGVDLVLGANEKFDLAHYIEARISSPSPWEKGSGDEAGGAGGLAVFSPIKDVRTFIPSYNANDRTRTFLKVQDGCDYFCSFCTIPLARGRSRSATIAETVELAKTIGASGVKEIVLTGVNTGDFGKSAPLRIVDPRVENFLGLVQALDGVEGIQRFRISSIEPNLCHDGIIDFVAESKRFAPHFHMPLQSGSDVILERMRRRYDTALYAERVNRIKERMPHACIGVDVITGTPGETEEEFLRTHEFLRSIPVDYLHVFTYSERANTTAVRMDDSVPMNVRRERTKQLRILSNKLQRAFYQRHLGTTRPVLCEAEENEGRMLGFTDNYLRVSMPFDAKLVNTLTQVHLERINADGHMQGSFLETSAVSLSEDPAEHSERPPGPFVPQQTLRGSSGSHRSKTSVVSLAEDPAGHAETAGSTPASGDPTQVWHGEQGANTTTMEGYTDNYLRVTLPYDPAMANTIIPVSLERINGDGQITGSMRPNELRSVDPPGRHYRVPVAN